MTSYTKQSLAAAAGVSNETFRRWLKHDPHYLQLCQRFHIPRNARLLPPPIVNYLNEHYVLDL